MKLARIVKWDARPWGLRNGGKINPPIGTKITYKEWKRACSLEIYVPGFNGFARMSKRYFEDFFDEIS